MHLSPREIEKLMLHQAGFLAQKRLARGVRLNYPEAVALIATQVLEFIRDGKTVADLMDLGRQMLGRNQVLFGVPEMIHEVQVEGTFPDGTKLVTVHHPICQENGDLGLALYGSFLPTPSHAEFEGRDPLKLPYHPGTLRSKDGQITLNEGRDAIDMKVTNLGDRPIQVGSHYHFVETNKALRFDREAAIGRRLDIPAGTAVRFEPGETKSVQLVMIAGKKIIRGGNNIVDGAIDDGNVIQSAMANVEKGEFANQKSD